VGHTSSNPGRQGEQSRVLSGALNVSEEWSCWPPSDQSGHALILVGLGFSWLARGLNYHVSILKKF